LRTTSYEWVHGDGTRNQTDREFPSKPTCMRVSFPLYDIVEQDVERVTKWSFAKTVGQPDRFCLVQ